MSVTVRYEEVMGELRGSNYKLWGPSCKLWGPKFGLQIMLRGTDTAASCLLYLDDSNHDYYIFDWDNQ